MWMLIQRLLRSPTFRMLLIRVGPAVGAQAVRLAQQGQWRQLAILHADSLVDGQFSREVLDDGAPHWIVWQGARPVAAYPEFSGSLEAAVAGHDPAIRRRPEELPTRRAREAGNTGAQRAGHKVGRLLRRPRSGPGP